MWPLALAIILLQTPALAIAAAMALDTDPRLNLAAADKDARPGADLRRNAESTALLGGGAPLHAQAQAQRKAHSLSGTRKLQTATTCARNSDASSDVVCPSGTVPIDDAGSTPGSDASDCCRCPAGATNTYADQALAFRFRADGITQDDQGAPVWNAVFPSGLAFVMERTIVPDSTIYMEMENGPFYPDYPETAPNIVTTADGQPSGLNFFYDTSSAVLMYSNKKVAFGSKYTFFAGLTPEGGEPLPLETLLGFRPVEYERGLFAFNVGSALSSSPAVRTVIADTWGYNGYKSLDGALQNDVAQVLIVRSDYGVTRTSTLEGPVEGPVVEIAVVDGTSLAPTIEWSLDMYGAGPVQYWHEQTESFELDFRDPTVDETRLSAAGFMMLGNQIPSYSFQTQLRATVHHMELHSDTLTYAHILDALTNVQHAMSPDTIAAAPHCLDCGAGMRDSDSDPSTPCVPCAQGTFSDQHAQTDCTGTCTLGSTIVTVGATSESLCSECLPGTHGHTEATTAVCAPCTAGRASAILGASSSAACVSCPSGRFSPPGSTDCELSGCMDEWAVSALPKQQVPLL
jgi:hypothetical protein